jgi:DNA-binding IclR family transcriptional regulator
VRWKELEPEIDRTVERGYALDLQQMDEGAVCVGAAIVSSSGHPVGGISVSGWVQRLDRAKQNEIGESLSNWCRTISEDLGAFSPEDEVAPATALA